jgi:type IV secretory pathway TrbF-like protein
MDRTENPYLAQRYAHNERYLQLSRTIRNWQLIAGGLVLSTLSLAGGLVVVTQQQKVVPYIVEVDELGVARYVNEVRPQAVHEPVVVSADLGQYIRELRTITPDRRLLREQTTLAWRRSLPPAQQTIRAFYTDNKIEEILQKGRILPTRLQVTPLSEKTYRAVWVDEFTGLDGTLLTEVPWEATIEVALIVPWELSVEERKLSPLGIFVNAITWHPV